MPYKKSPLSIMICLAVSAAFSTHSRAQTESEQHADHAAEAHHYSEIEEIIVRALPMRRTRMESAQPVDVLAGELLNDRRGMTLGETLQSQPGVQSSFYGAGAGRPVIRGLGGPRVRVLEDGLSTADTSTQSDDHAVTSDPMLIDQIEILRGPATLLYGSAASAGVVNLIDGRIPEQLPAEPVSGRFELRGDSIAEERSGVVRLDGARNQLAWHLDGSWREADDYRIPGVARLEGHDEHDEHDEDEHEVVGGRLSNSFVESRSATGGLSWIGDRGFIGASLRTFSSEYGIPAPHAHFEEEHDEDEHDEHGHDDHGHDEHEEDEYAYIDMLQRSWDIKAGLDNPFRGVERLSFRYGLSDYQHTEVELAGHEDDDDHAEEDEHDHGGTVFDVKTWQARLSLETSEWVGWQGAVGLQAERENFQAEGAEAFVPDSLSRTYGLFVLQERQFDNFTLSLGARYENSRVSNLENDFHAHDEDEHDEDEHDDHHDPERPFADQRHYKFRNVSASIGGIYAFNDNWQMSVNFARSQRAPAAAELLAQGPHLATFTYELGNGGLTKEVSRAWDVTLHRHSTRFDFEVTLFRKDIQDFIYLASTGQEFGGFPVRLTTQDDAEFSGIEAQGVWQLFTNDYGHFEVRTTFDRVNAELLDGSRLPRISPARFSAGLDWHRDMWRGSVEATRVMKQDKVPVLEEPVAGYTMINAKLARTFELGGAQLEAFIQGRNLGDSEARVATSYLKDYAPLPGRNLVLGVRGSF